VAPIGERRRNPPRGGEKFLPIERGVLGKKTSGAALDGYLEPTALLRRGRRINVRQSKIGPAEAFQRISAAIDPESDICNRRQTRDPLAFDSAKRPDKHAKMC
jgi:hypothetical protein